jgi:hypothetical protein
MKGRMKQIHIPPLPINPTIGRKNSVQAFLDDRLNERFNMALARRHITKQAALLWCVQLFCDAVEKNQK